MRLTATTYSWLDPGDTKLGGSGRVDTYSMPIVRAVEGHLVRKKLNFFIWPTCPWTTIDFYQIAFFNLLLHLFQPCQAHSSKISWLDRWIVELRASYAYGVCLVTSNRWWPDAAPWGSLYSTSMRISLRSTSLSFPNTIPIRGQSVTSSIPGLDEKRLTDLFHSLRRWLTE